MRWAEIVNLGLPVALLAVGYFVGRLLEQRHYASIRARERELQPIVALSTRYIPDGVDASGASTPSGM